MMSAASKCMVESCLRTKLQARFNPTVLRLINESYMHNVPEGSETHFKVVVVSGEFDGMPLIKVAAPGPNLFSPLCSIIKNVHSKQKCKNAKLGNAFIMAL